VAGFQSKLQTLSVWPSSFWTSFNSNLSIVCIVERFDSAYTRYKHRFAYLLLLRFSSVQSASYWLFPIFSRKRCRESSTNETKGISFSS
jgi:hypothetical protein